MLPLIHLIPSLIVVGFLFPFYSYWSFTFLIGSFLIDVDHYLWYVFRFKSFNLKKAYIYSLPENKREKDSLHIFHVWEFWVLLGLLSFIHKFIFIVFVGVVFHIILDFVDSLKRKCSGARATSYFAWLRRHPRV
ncbi:MAG: hypothetical protein ABIB47_00970 [Candidatus Woesearchaeota archaeon]